MVGAVPGGVGEMSALEDAIGWTFRDRALIETALTAPARKMDHPEVRDNQRLEFLGDAVFGLLSAERLYRDFADEGEGLLTMRRTRLASGAAMAAAAAKIGLARELRVNCGAPHPADRSKAAADAMEALLGAVWMDGGLEAARAVFARLWPREEAGGADDVWADNPKGRLQCITQARRPPVCPKYETLSSDGPPHAPVWRAAVEVPGAGRATGEGRTRKAAETAAAAAMIEKISAGECADGA